MISIDMRARVKFPSPCSHVDEERDKTMRKCIPTFLKVFECVGNLGLVCLSSLVILQVILRNLRIANFPWIDEAARLAHVIIIFAITPSLFCANEHIVAEVFRPTSKGAQEFLKLMSTIANAVFCTLFLLSGAKLVSKLWNVPLAALRIPTLFLYLAPLAGMVASLVSVSNKLFEGELNT